MDIKNTFTYHAPNPDQAQRYQDLRTRGGDLARTIAYLCPPSAETTLALRAVQQAVMWANASIAINEAPQLS